ncbi:MAG: DUF1385 domain-containing protein [Syntrophomonadaceae bacterium]|nr:DUF1385 domain-containing protein [Syntrophomonadaceae bacterium]
MGKNIQYGGQAVIEGVMMRGPDAVALAVRKPTGEIVIEKEAITSPRQKYKVLGWPLIRGGVVLVDSLMLGVKTLNRSAVLAGEEDEQLSSTDLIWTTVLAILLALVLFVALPTGIVHFAKGLIGGVMAQNVVEGIVRFLVFLGYVWGISRLNEIQRVFKYHGAEHKVINTFESGAVLNVENTGGHSILHPRCGTSFLLIVMVISILVFACLGEGSLLWRVFSRVAVFPIVAGLGYEFIKLTSRFADRDWARWLMAPGLWLQKLTTGEPDDDQIEVALQALAAVMEPPPSILSYEG